MAALLDAPGTFNPHLAAGVDEHLVDGRVAQQRVEPTEPLEAGKHRVDQRGGMLGPRQRGQPAHVAAHCRVDITRFARGDLAHRGDEVFVGGGVPDAVAVGSVADGGAHWSERTDRARSTGSAAAVVRMNCHGSRVSGGQCAPSVG